MGNFIEKIFVPDLESQIKRYPKVYRSRLRGMARDCGYLANLLTSFPAAAYTLVSIDEIDGDRKNAWRLLKNGQPLRLIADALGLPYWLRKAPPEALQRGLGGFPKDPEFHRKLAGAFPQNLSTMTNWLILVPLAACYGNKDFALWLAKQKFMKTDKDFTQLVHLLSLYAWLSDHPDTFAGAMITQPWNKNVQFETLTGDVRNWLDRVKEKLFYGIDGIHDSWLERGKAGGFTFVPLLTPEELKQEGEIMNHCVRTYALDLPRQECRIFSIRHGAQHVATLEIRLHYSHPGIPCIEQLLGKDNMEVPPRVWKATFAWLAKQATYNIPARCEHPVPDGRVWTRLWKPYWDEKGLINLLPFETDAKVVAELDKVFE